MPSLQRTVAVLLGSSAIASLTFARRYGQARLRITRQARCSRPPDRHKIVHWISVRIGSASKLGIREGDILILHTGWHCYWEEQKQQDLVRYFCMHPGGKIELLDWMLKKKIKWFGFDCGSGDHAMNTSIRLMRPDLAKRFEAKVGMSCDEFLRRV